LSAVTHSKPISGPEFTMRYNLYRSAQIMAFSQLTLTTEHCIDCDMILAKKSINPDATETGVSALRRRVRVAAILKRGGTWQPARPNWSLTRLLRDQGKWKLARILILSKS
jgi:hypothetical protein